MGLRYMGQCTVHIRHIGILRQQPIYELTATRFGRGDTSVLKNDFLRFGELIFLHWKVAVHESALCCENKFGQRFNCIVKYFWVCMYID